MLGFNNSKSVSKENKINAKQSNLQAALGRGIMGRAAQPSRNPLVPLTGCFNNNRLKTEFEKNLKKPAQSKVVDTIGEEAMATMDEATLHRVTAMITEESKDRNLLSPGQSEKPNS